MLKSKYYASKNSFFYLLNRASREENQKEEDLNKKKLFFLKAVKVSSDFVNPFDFPSFLLPFPFPSTVDCSQTCVSSSFIRLSTLVSTCICKSLTLKARKRIPLFILPSLPPPTPLSPTQTTSPHAEIRSHLTVQILLQIEVELEAFTHLFYFYNEVNLETVF